MASKHRPVGCLCTFIYWPREGTRIPEYDCPIHGLAASIRAGADTRKETTP